MEDKVEQNVKKFHSSMTEIQEENKKFDSYGNFTSEYALLDGLLYEYEEKFKEVLKDGN